MGRGGVAIPRFSWAQGHLGCSNSRRSYQSFLDKYFSNFPHLKPRWVELDIGMYTSPAQALLSNPVSALLTPDKAADSHMFPVERRNPNNTEDAQYIAAFWHVHSYLISTECLDRAAWFLSSAHEHANCWLYPSRNATSWFSNQPTCLTEKEYLQALRTTLLVALHGLKTDVCCRCPPAIIQGQPPQPQDPAREAFHFLDCPDVRCFRMWCHESVSNAISKYLKKRLADVAITRTPSLQTKQANTNRIADLVVTPEECAGKYIDFTVSNPAAPTYYNKVSHSSATKPNSTNLFREKEKCSAAFTQEPVQLA